MPKGWTFSTLFRDVDAAFKWGYRDPNIFWLLSEETQAIMVAYLDIKDEMKYVEDREQAKKMESVSSKGRNK